MTPNDDVLTQQQGPGVAVDEAPEAASEALPDNYYERVEILTMRMIEDGTYTNEALEEMKEREKQEETFWSRFTEFFGGMGSALRVWLMGSVFGSMIERFSGYFGQLRAAQERLENAQDELLERTEGIREGAAELRENAEGFAAEVADGVDVDGALEGLQLEERQSSFLESLAVPITAIGGIGIVSSLLPENFSFGRTRLALRFIRPLLMLGGIGAAFAGLYLLHQRAQDNPGMLADMPEDLHERALWVREKISELDLPEGLAFGDADLDLMASLAVGQENVEEAFADLLGQGEELEEGTTEEDIEVVPEGQISLAELERRMANQYHDMFLGVRRYANDHRYLARAALGTALYLGVATSRGRDVLTAPVGTMVGMSEITYEFGTNHTFAFGGLILAMAGARDYIMNNSDQIYVPEDPVVLKDAIIEHMRTAGGELSEAVERVDMEELDAALDYVLGINDVAFDILIDAEEFIGAVAGTGVDIVATTPEERLFENNDIGINSLWLLLQTHYSEENEPELYEAYRAFLASFNQNQRVDLDDFEQLRVVLEEYNVRFVVEEGIYRYVVLNGPGDGTLVNDHGNFFIDPSLSLEDQIEISESYVTSGRVLGTFTNIIGMELRELASRAQDAWNIELPESMGDSDILRAMLGVGSLAVLAGEVFFIDNLGEQYVIGPWDLWAETIEQAIDGEEFDMLQFSAEYAHGVAPVVLIGSFGLIRPLLQGRVFAAGGTTLRLIGYPVSTSWMLVRSLFDRRYRSYTASKFTGNVLLRNLPGQFFARFRDAHSYRTLYEVQSHIWWSRRFSPFPTVTINKRYILSSLDNLEMRRLIPEGGLNSRQAINDFDIALSEEMNRLSSRSGAEAQRMIPPEVADYRQRAQTLESIRSDVDTARQSGAAEADVRQIGRRLEAIGVNRAYDDLRPQDLEALSDLLGEEIDDLRRNATALEVDARVSVDVPRINTDIPSRVSVPEAPRRGGIRGGLRRARGVIGFGLTVGTLLGLSRAADAYHNEELDPMDFAQVPSGEIPTQEEMLSDEQLYEQEHERFMQETLDFISVGSGFNELFGDIERVMNMSESQRTIAIDEILVDYEAGKNRVRDFVLENRDVINSIYENTPPEERGPIVFGTGADNYNPFFVIQYDEEEGHAYLEYDSTRALRRWAFDQVDMIETFGDDILQGNGPSGWDVARDGLSYAAPLYGTYRDFSDMGESIERGDWWGAAGSGAWGVLGAVSDAALVVPVIGQAGAGIFRAIRGGSAAARTAQTTSRVARLVEAARNTYRAVRNFKIFGSNGGRLVMIGMVGDAGRQFLIDPSRGSRLDL